MTASPEGEPEVLPSALSDTAVPVPLEPASAGTLVDELVLPLAEEVARIEKRTIVTGRVRIGTMVETQETTLRDTLVRQGVEVDEVAFDTIVDAASPPTTREEDGVLIIPVLEERPVVERRLFLVKELRVRRVTQSEPVEIPVSLRRERAVVTRTPEPPAGVGEPTTPQEALP